MRQMFAMDILMSLSAAFLSLCFLVVKPASLTLFIFTLGLLRLVWERFNYRSPIVAFIVPWLLLSTFVSLPITSFSRELTDLSTGLMAVPILVASFFGFGASEVEYLDVKNSSNERMLLLKGRYYICMIIMYALFFVNFIYSGYLPLFKSINGFNSDYIDYGIKGVNGLFYAFSNCFGLLSYYLWIIFKKKSFLVNFFIVIIMFLLCMTRQNLISLAVETIILQSFIVGRASNLKLLIGIMAIIFLFGMLGELRSGDIREIMGLLPDYDWLPTPFIWVYSYGFFNILNLDNLVRSGEYELFNGSSFASLIPSFLRPQMNDQSDILEVINFNIASYLDPLLADIGPYGVVIFTIIAVIFTLRFYKKAIVEKNFSAISIYSILYFCALFSFFINFWLYLPVIFQIPFAMIFGRYVVKVKPAITINSSKVNDLLLGKIEVPVVIPKLNK